jgi:hypothetical protein
MCFFITIAVPEDAAGAVCANHSGRGMEITPTRSAAARVAAGAGRVPLLVTGGGCSCGWYTRPGGADAEARLARARARYQRLGWSGVKIERALAGMARPARAGDGLHAVIVDLLRAVVRAHGPVAVWVHDFSGKVEREPYTIARRERWALEDLAARAALLSPDVLAEVGV